MTRSLSLVALLFVSSFAARPASASEACDGAPPLDVLGAAVGRQDDNARQHLVSLSRELGEHLDGFGVVLGFAEQPALEHDGGIGGQHDGVGARCERGRGLLAGEALNIGGGILTRPERLVDVDGRNVEREPGSLQQLAAARALRGKDERSLSGRDADSIMKLPRETALPPRRTARSFFPLHQAMPGAIDELLRRAPISDGKVAFAWRVAVGPAMSRATRATLSRPGELLIDVKDERWRRELRRSERTILARLERLLGGDLITRIVLRDSD